VSSSAGCLTASRALNAAVRVGLAMTAVSAGSMRVAGFAQAMPAVKSAALRITGKDLNDGIFMLLCTMLERLFIVSIFSQRIPI
jgi:hypothetical protein